MGLLACALLWKTRRWRSCAMGTPGPCPPRMQVSYITHPSSCDRIRSHQIASESVHWGDMCLSQCLVPAHFSHPPVILYPAAGSRCRAACQGRVHALARAPTTGCTMAHASITHAQPYSCASDLKGSSMLTIISIMLPCPTNHRLPCHRPVSPAGRAPACGCGHDSVRAPCGHSHPGSVHPVCLAP